MKRDSGVILKRSDARLQGAALVIVLAFLVIITGLVVAFLSSVTNEATATAASAAGVTTRSLADAAIQLDIAQIRDATAGFDANSNVTGWASQPGAIRVFSTNYNGAGSTGGGGVSLGSGGASLYKLYTAPVMRTNGGVASNDLPASGWWSNAALYVDLNAPVVKPNGDGTTTTNYPIMDPAMTNQVSGTTSPIVDGFSIDTTASCYYSNNPAAMPVTWLYMLKNGTLIAPDSNSSTTATFANAATQPNSTNPIVGRIAYWTDDETCKLNINTASEGMPWDPPTFESPEEIGYNNYAPGANEYNRFLGHPFSVSLSPVLWSFFGFQHPAQLVWSTPPNWTNVTSTNTLYVWQDLPPVQSPLIKSNLTSPTNYINALFGMSNVVNGILPRTPPSTNGSFFGSFRTIATNNRVSLTNLPTRGDRLYASVDEMNYLVTNGLTAPRTNNSTLFTPQTISRLRFFLTAESRAPEVNILNLPRICLWPENDTNNANTNNPNFSASNPRSFLDQIIAQCSTLGTNAYYFTRYDAGDPGNDFTGRNKILYGYLAQLLQTPMPGFAGTNGTSTFATRWSTNATYEMATLCFDYIRSSINLIDSYGSTNGPGGTDATNPAQRYAYAYTVPPTNTVSVSTANDDTNTGFTSKSLPPGAGQVIPITITTNGVTTRGMGRFPVIKSVNLVFCAVAADQPPLMISNTGTTPRAPLVPYQINPLHPYPYSVALSSFISNNPAWDLPVATNFIINLVDSNGNITGTSTVRYTNVVQFSTNASSSPSQYPSIYPTNLGLMSFTRGTNATNLLLSSPVLLGYTNNWATNITVLYTNTNSTVTIINTNSYQCLTNTGISGLSNANALTITHAGLVYGGDLDTNNPSGINYGFDAYNLYFSNIASSLGMATTATVNYVQQAGVQVASTGFGKYSATPFTNYLSNNLTIPNTNSPLFPQPYQTVMQPILLINHALTTPGFPPYSPNFKIRVSGLGNLKADGANCWPSGVSGQLYTNASQDGLGYPDAGPDLFGMSLQGNAASSYVNGNAASTWPFVGNFVKVTNNASPIYGRTFSFGGGTITVDYLKPAASYSTTATSDILQSVTISIPSSSFPTPKLPPFNGAETAAYNYQPWLVVFGTSSPINFINPKYLLPSNSLPPNINTPLNGAQYYNMGWFFMNEQWGLWTNASNACSYATQMSSGNAMYYNTATTIRAIEAGYGDWRLPAMMRTIVSSTNGVTAPAAGSYGYTLTTMTNLYIPHLLYFASGPETTTGLGVANTGNTNFYWRPAHSIRGQQGFLTDSHAGHTFTSVPGEFLQSFVNFATNSNDAGLVVNPGVPAPSNIAGRLFAHIAHSSGFSTGSAYPDALSTVDFYGYVTNSLGTTNLFANVWANGGDFDNPIGGGITDGPYINKADEGTAGWNDLTSTGWATGLIGAGYNGSYPPWGSLGRARFCPNRQVPSAGILGSLPAGFDPSNPSLTNAWQSLVFCANPNASNRVASMPNPPDYMIMDLFDMPVVQPYPISDPFSTAGRVNLNYQIAPFANIHRDSALRGVLKSVDMAAVPENAIGSYKNGFRNYTYMGTNGATNYYSYYYPIHLNQTLAKFDAKFASNGFFRAGAEICSMWLYPALAPNNGTTAANVSSTYATNPATAVVSDTGTNLTNIRNWWYANPGTTRKGLTGANVRARPYMGIYANITTKSNTYQIHYRVQTLKQTSTAHGSSWTTWIDPAAGGITDKVIGESRGSAVIERYIDPSDPNIPDFAANFASSGGGSGASVANTNTMDAYYRFRVFNAKQFTP
jgi:uncharacterized protein (TIGR02600 family)